MVETLKTAPSRRAMLTGSAALLTSVTAVLAAQAAPANPDVQLIAACARYFEIEDYFDLRYSEEDIDKNDPALWKSSDILDKAVELRATTLLGHVARAKIMARCFPGLLVTKEGDGDDDYLVSALLRDLIREARV